MVINCLEIRHQAIDEAQGLDEVLKLDSPRELVLRQFPARQSGHDGAEFLLCQDLRLVHILARRRGRTSTTGPSLVAASGEVPVPVSVMAGCLRCPGIERRLLETI